MLAARSTASSRFRLPMLHRSLGFTAKPSRVRVPEGAKGAVKKLTANQKEKELEFAK